MRKVPSRYISDAKRSDRGDLLELTRPDEELCPRALMAKLTSEINRKIDETFAKKNQKNSN